MDRFRDVRRWLPESVKRTRRKKHGTAGARLELMPNSPPDNPVHAVILPHDEPLFPPGPGREEFITACVVCHSPPIHHHAAQVLALHVAQRSQKMKDLYGAHISDEQVAKITDYLVSIDGKSDTGQAPKGRYGE